MSRSLLARYSSLCLTAALAWTGCSKKETGSLAKIDTFKPTAGSTNAAVTNALQNKRVVLLARTFVPVTVRGLDNTSIGTFKAQVRIAFGALTGLISGQSLAFLRLDDAETSGIYQIGGRYLAGTDGFFAISSLANGPITLPISYAGKHEIDLQIEQTETELKLSSRVPPDLGGNGLWHQQGSQARSPGGSFYLSIGMANVEKQGRFYYSDFRLSGAGIGGAVEGPLNVLIQDSTAAIRAAQAKLNHVPPDLVGALADLDTALLASGAAVTGLDTAWNAGTLQGTTLGLRASKMLGVAEKKLKSTRAVVAKQDARKALTASRGLKSVIGNMEGAIGNLLGTSVPNLQSRPAIFSPETN
jgi:hypothetical protein